MSKENLNEFKIINKNERLKYRQTINELKQQLAEKQNTINEINKEFVQAVHDWKTLCAEKDKEISKLQASYQQVKTQFAIQELEKVKMQLKDKTKMMSNEEHYYQQKVVSWYDICNQVNKQIKELKGEKE